MFKLQAPIGLRTISVESLLKLRDDCTEIMLSPCSLRTTYQNQFIESTFKNRTMIVYNVNTYAVARRYLRCLKNRTENLRRKYRTTPVANVN